jgi:hypothetical protein
MAQRGGNLVERDVGTEPATCGRVAIVTELNTNPENGKTHARVAWLNSPGGGPGIKLKRWAPRVGGRYSPIDRRVL